MNLKAPNIVLCLLLAGCSSFHKNKDGENINKNAPIFVRPNTNAIVPNKPIDTKVEYQGQKYILVKETDLNLLINRKVNESAPNKSLVAAPAPVGENSPPPAKIGENSPPTQLNVETLAVPVIRLEPIEEKKESNSSNWPLFFLVATCLFLLPIAAWYFLYYRPQNQPRPLN
jgi:hypothetical protein